MADSGGAAGASRRSLSPQPIAPAEDRRGALDRRRPDPLSTARAHGAQTDEQLVAAVRRSEQGAFDTLAARYEKRLLGFCQQILRSKEDAEDALQDVFTCAFNAILADERPIQVRPWLYRIAKNRCINQLRRATAIAVDSMDDRYADRGLTLVDKVLTRQNFRDLVADVKMLPDTQRVALLLREIDGFAYERIAIAMSTTVPAVKSLLVRARTGLLTSAESRAATGAATGPILRPRRSRARARSDGAETLTYRGALAAATAASAQRPRRTSPAAALVQRRSPTRGSRQPGPRARAITTTSTPQTSRPAPRRSAS
jgi:RNA polymerase sigma factor (sigma-70 family)